MSYLTNTERIAILKFQQAEEIKRKERAFFNKAKMEHMRYLAEQERKMKNRSK